MALFLKNKGFTMKRVTLNVNQCKRLLNIESAFFKMQCLSYLFRVSAF